MRVLGSNPTVLLDDHPEAYYALPDKYKTDRLLLFKNDGGELTAELDLGGVWRFNSKLGGWEPWPGKR